MALLFVGLLGGCTGGGPSNDGWRVSVRSDADAGDVSSSKPGSDVLVDGRANGDVADDVADDEIVPCPEAPTAVISASADSVATNIQGTKQGSFEVRPMPKVQLDAEGSMTHGDQTIERVEWEVLEQPEPSIATFGEGMAERIYTTSDEQSPRLLLSLAGDYEVGLRVWNGEGQSSCNTARLKLKVRPDPETDIYIDFRQPYKEHSQYAEHPPYVLGGDSLAFKFKRTQDASWVSDTNVVPSPGDELTRDWGKKGDSSDDPQMRRVRGGTFGPCYVTLNDLEKSTTYVAGVWTGNLRQDDSSYYFPVTGTFRIYIDGELQTTMKKTIDKHEEGTFLYEIFHIEKVEDTYKIVRSDRVNKDYPAP